MANTLSASLLGWLRCFEAAARHCNFTQAAAELCVTQGAVSQQVKQLEQWLDRPLFLRTPRALVLTPTRELAAQVEESVRNYGKYLKLRSMVMFGGVGINLAVQDAVAAANILVPVLRNGAPSDDDLAAVQARREFPAKATQMVQVFIQNNVISHMLHKAGEQPHAPFLLRALTATRWFRRIPAQAVGMGVRPEHISPEILKGH